jgi:eukaryotic-like serine/threonine-protein kinase
MSPTAARTLNGRYRLHAQLGSGGVASVYRGMDLMLERDVAVKVVERVTEVREQPFAREVAALGRLSHPAIVRLYDGGRDRDLAYLVMELVEGQPLSPIIARDAPLDEPRIRAIGAAVAAALRHAHAEGCIHRDVKPSNILVDEQGEVRVTDFGIAKVVDQAVTTTSGILGTAAYLAPEQVASRPVGPATDVYALGLVLIECWTGRKPFTGSWTEVAVARLHRSPAIPDGIPEPWPDLLRAMTSPDPADRPSAAEVAEVLAGRRLLAAPEPPSAPQSDATAVLPPTVDVGAHLPTTGTARQHNWWLAVLIGALVLLAAWLFLGAEEPGGDVDPAPDAPAVETGADGTDPADQAPPPQPSDDEPAEGEAGSGEDHPHGGPPGQRGRGRGNR